MKTVFKAAFLCLLLFCQLSCTVYTEKQSEALSRVVYASKDSVDAARFDLVDQYTIEATRIVRPPKQRIQIASVYKKQEQRGVTKDRVPTNQRVVVIPQQYKNDLVIVVKSDEYQKLLEDRTTFEQFKQDHEQLTQAKQAVDQELIQQTEYRDKMVKDLNTMQRKLAEKDLIILHRNIMIVCLLATFGAGVYFKLKGII
jgi:hypothetical protein